MSGSPASVRPPWLFRDPAFVGLLLVLAAFLAHVAGVVGGTFHFDDFHNLRDNEAVRSLANLPRFFTDPSTWSELPGNTMYRPVQMATYAVDHALWGYRPAGWLLTNLLLHACVAVLVWRLAVRLGLSPLASFLAGLVMALHPVHSEVVNYVSSRSESLAAALVLAALHAHLTARRAGIAGCVAWTAVAAVLSAAALGAKETAACFFLAVAWMELLLARAHRPVRRVLRAAGWAAAYGAAFAAMMLLRSAVLGRATADVHVFATPAGADTQAGGTISVLDNLLLVQSRVVVLYHQLLALPVRLNVDHDVSRTVAWSVSSVAALAIHAGLVAWALREAVRGRRLFPLCVGWFCLFLLPSVAFPLNVVMNEHRLYLPGIAVALLAGAALARAADLLAPRLGGRAAAWTAAAPLLLFVPLSMQRSLEWRSDLALWTVAVARDDTARARMHLGAAYATLANERTDTAERRALLERALAEYLVAAERHPRWYDLQLNMGTTHVLLGRITGDRAHFEAALEAFRAMGRIVGRDRPRPRYLEAEALTQLGRFGEAVSILRDLRSRDPTVTTLYDDAEAKILRLSGDRAGAREVMARVVAIEEPLGRVDGLLTLAWWNLEDGDARAAERGISRAMEIAKEGLAAGRPAEFRPFLYAARMLRLLGQPGAESFEGRARALGWTGEPDELAWVRGGATPGALRGTAGLPAFQGGR